MVWGCMGWNGVGLLIEVQGKMDAEQCCGILDEGVVESFEKLDMPKGELLVLLQLELVFLLSQQIKFVKS